MAYTNLELPPPPPQPNKDREANFYSFVQWMIDFYRSLVLNGYYISRNESVIYEDFDADNLVDPESATLATAQDTANEAHGAAVAAQTQAESAQTTANSAVAELNSWVHGQVTISNTATTGAVTFATAQDDASYQITAGVGASSGAGLPAECFLMTGITSVTAAGFTINIHTAPGAGNTVSYNWMLRR
jgi:hypothetical protein